MGAGYMYMAGGAIVLASAVLNLFDGAPRQIFAACILGAVAAFCAYMARKSRQLLRTTPVPSRTEIGIWGGATFLFGSLAGFWLVIGLFIPYALLVLAVQREQHDA